MIACLVALSGILATLKPQDSHPASPPEIPREFRGVWVASVDNIDWPSAKGLDIQHARQELVNLVETAEKNNLNAILFQIRPSTDALYPSTLEPWSEYLTGAQGIAPDPAWDPLAELIELAHGKGIEVHAWVNPFRAWHPAAKGQPAPNWVGKQHPEWLVQHGPYQWLNPAIPGAREHSLKVIEDIAKRYKVDGMHIDDYFYPYPVKTGDFADATQYAEYVASGGKLDKPAWRRECVNIFIAEMYDRIHKVSPGCKVGISPFGIYRPGVPEGIKAGVDQYIEMGSDPVKWLQEGKCDYMSPQLYWKVSSVEQNYQKLLDWWQSQNTLGRQMWPGLYTSRLTDSNWGPEEISAQIDLTRKTKLPSQGHVHFSMKAFVKNPKNLVATLAPTYAQPAFIPECAWLPNEAPGKPLVSLQTGSLVWTAGRGVLSYAVGFLNNGSWKFSKVGPASLHKIPVLPGAEKAIVYAVGFGGKATSSAQIDLKK